MKKLTIALAALAALCARPALAQGAQEARRFEVATYVGAYVPTGNQRDVLDDAALVGLTASYDVSRYLALVGSFGWATTEVKGLAQSDLYLFQYDVGLQGQYAIETGGGVTLKPFVGLGVGARTYSFRDLNVSSETDVAGYFAVGGSVEYRLATLSLTAREYVSAYDGLGISNTSSTRNDLGLCASFGMRL